MATSAQFAANQRNAALSTGPRSPEGKEKVGANAVSHGLAGRHIVLPGEDPAEFDALLEALRAEHNADTPTLNFLVQEMAHAQWKLIRIASIEQQILAAAFSPENESASSPLAQLFLKGGSPDDALQQLTRYEASARRAYYQALKQITAFQSSRQSQQASRKKQDRRESRTALNDLLDAYINAPMPGYASRHFVPRDKTKPISATPRNPTALPEEEI
jgi:hypothetical protein